MGDFAGRTDFWNIGYPFAGALVYLIAPIALASIAYALRRRWRLWHTAGADANLGPTGDPLEGVPGTRCRWFGGA